MRSPHKAAGQAERRSFFWDALTLERMVTGSLVHLVYWFGLGIIALGGFAGMGVSVGTALREGPIMGWLLAIPFAVAWLLAVLAFAILWRSFCELYVVVIQIGDDLHALRLATETEGIEDAPATSAPPRRTRRAPTA